MFDNFVVAKQTKARRWVVVLVTVSALVHAVVVGALLVRSFWVIEKVSAPDAEASIGLAPPPPPPPPPGGKKKPEQTENKKKKVQATEVQPTKVKEEQKVEDESEDEGEEGGVVGGVAGGVVGGVLGGVEGGVLGGDGGNPPPEKPQIVPQTALDAQRISGEKQIQPPDTTKTQIKRDGKSRVTAVVKICLDASGAVSSLRVLRSSGYEPYDRVIKSKMNQWKYRPFKVNGKAVPVCSAVTFIYTQS